ncbi:hypothetical protein [Microvirga antarctica]|uniref:hypothetical protein n=1 Tax=Microvirga antarctica TaxID=2819233 RepID=UPI001B302A69|nr:hypothetical protein [Microvirga antarctica]
MKPLSRLKSRRSKPVKRSRVARVVRGSAYSCVAVAVLIAVAFGLLYMRLSAGPLSFGSLPDRVAESIAARIGPGWSVTLRDTALELHGGAPALRANGLDVRDPAGGLVLRAPSAVVSVDGVSLLTGNLQPKSIEVRDLQLRVLVARDGALTFSPVPPGEGGEQPAPTGPGPLIEVAPRPGVAAPDASPVSNVVGSLFDLIVGPQSILNSLDRARLTNARLIFVDADQRQRAAFNRVDATFDWADDGGRRFEASLEGSQGAWELNGDADPDGAGGYRAEIHAKGAPIQDILLLAGQSALPATTDLAFSGRVDAAYSAGRVTELKATLSSEAGQVQVHDKDTSPIIVEHSDIAVSWDEAAKALDLVRLHMRGGQNEVTLTGRLTTRVPHDGWTLALAGKDIVLSGAAAGDSPVRIASLAGELSGPEGVVLKSLRLRGEDLSAEIDGVLASATDPGALALKVRGAKTSVRTALRLWPEAANLPVRQFLIGSLKGGRVESMDLKVAMSGAEMTRAVNGGPIAPESLAIDFAITDGVFFPAQGLAPLSQANVTGVVSGVDVRLRAPSARVDLDGGRHMTGSDGSFVLENYWRPDAAAAIDFRLTGGADGLGALLQQPLVHEMAGFEVDPAAMKGNADLKVRVGLPVKHIPPFADLPIAVSGTVTDLGIDKIFGKDKLEGAKVAIAYDKGDLTIKGDGRIGGSPAVIDLHQTPGGGEANVTFNLDEAARAKRGLSFGSQLTGTLPLRVVVPLGKEAKPGLRVDADLTKVAIDQLVPGWVKPAGRAAKLSFTTTDASATEIRDLQLDSGATQFRGSASLNADGGLDKADLSTFKLSPGDDMRAQVDRSGGVYKVVIRGNVGDARPFAKAADAPPATGRNAGSTRDSRDFDLDLNLNILTGFNEEAITNAAVKASVRKDNMRQLDLKGRLGATNLTARTVSAPGGSPQIVVQSDNAGSLLRFLDIYKRMGGGDLVLQMGTGDGPQAGVLTVRDFSLSNEPALRRIIPTQTQVVAGQDSAGKPQAVRVDVNEARFSKARVDFTRSAGRLDFKDAAVFGSQVGFTLGGYIDNARDKMDVSGTFVPAYGLNNAFAQVPLFGPLLGGGQYEGLFAVNFRVSGPVAGPTLTVNPLSAVAPGFLRKLFGAGGEAPTGSLPTTPER